MYKQLIIARKDLNMSPGKLAAQVSHGSIAFLLHKIRESAVLKEDNKFRAYENGRLPLYNNKNQKIHQFPQGYRHPDLHRFAVEAEKQGESFFYAGLIDPSKDYGAMELQSRKAHYSSTLDFTEGEYVNWLNEAETKIILGAKNRNQLLKAKTIAEEYGLKEGKDFFLIYDACRTELKPEGPEGTLTVIGFKPLDESVADQIGRKFQLWH